MSERSKRVTGPLSWTSVSIDLVANKGGVELYRAQASGLFWKKPEGFYLVTNLHNVSGWDYARDKAMSPTGALPTDVRIHLAVEHPPYISWPAVNCPLVDSANNAKWFVHPQHGPKIDVAAVFLGSSDKILSLWPEAPPGTRLATRAINSLEEFADYDVNAGDDAYVLGYPLGLYGGERFPIWKRASIASEPDLDVDNLPKVLIDTATRRGMSGSPVVTTRSGLIPKRGSEEGGIRGDAMIGTVSSFLGVYSGRVDDDPLGAQLGIVWKASVIDEIIDAKVLGTRRPWE